jgi:hypothetical protein
VIDEDALSQRRRRVDVDLELLRRAALQEKRQVAPVPPPEVMREAVRRHGGKTLEEHERLQKAAGGRIAVDDSAQVGARRPADGGILGEDGCEQAIEQFDRERLTAERLRQAAGERRLEARRRQHQRHDQRRQRRLGAQHMLGLAAQTVPHRVGMAVGRGSEQVARVGGAHGRSSLVQTGRRPTLQRSVSVAARKVRHAKAPADTALLCLRRAEPRQPMLAASHPTCGVGRSIPSENDIPDGRPVMRCHPVRRSGEGAKVIHVIGYPAV